MFEGVWRVVRGEWGYYVGGVVRACDVLALRTVTGGLFLFLHKIWGEDLTRGVWSEVHWRVSGGVLTGLQTRHCTYTRHTHCTAYPHTTTPGPPKTVLEVESKLGQVGVVRFIFFRDLVGKQGEFRIGCILFVCSRA